MNYKNTSILLFCLLLFGIRVGYAQEKTDTLSSNKKKWEIGLLDGINFGKVAIIENGHRIKNFDSDKTLGGYFAKLSVSRKIHNNLMFRLNIQSKRLAYGKTYNDSGSGLKTKTFYDVGTLIVSCGFKHDSKKISLYTYIGTGLEFLIKKVDSYNYNIKENTWRKHYYSFSSEYYPKDFRWSVPVSLSLGMDIKLSRFISLSLSSGLDYNLTPYYLANDGSSDYGYVGHDIYHYSIYICSGITYKIQKHFLSELKKQDADENDRNKWTTSINAGPVIGFNVGKRYVPFDFSPNNVSPHVYWYYKDSKEKGEAGYQLSLDLISKSFLKKRLSLRMGLGYEMFYYTGQATTVEVDHGWTQPDTYNYFTHKDARKYSFKDYFVNFSVLPQINFNKGKKYSFYYFLGPSAALLVNEVSDAYKSEWQGGLKNLTAFGTTGFGSIIKRRNGFNLDLQLRFNYQVLTTPAGRRLAATGIRVGFNF